MSCAGDVDIFLVGAKAGDELAVLGKIYDITMAACQHLRGDNARLLVMRSRSAVTLFRGDKGAPLQVILNTYNCVEELLAGFDVDCACCAYVLGTGQFVCSARCRRSLEYRVNVMQSAHHSPMYASRLEKYASRGFAVALPGLDVRLLSADFRSSSYVLIKKRNLLLKVLSCDEGAPGLSLLTMPARTKVRDVRCRPQKAKRVSGVQRIVALSLAKIKEVDSPYVWKTTSNSDVLDAYNMDCPVLLHSEERPHDEYWLLWGVRPEDSDNDSDTDVEEDDEQYSVTPAAKAVMLFDSCLKWQTERLGDRDEEPSRDGRSGFIFKVAKSMKNSPLCTKSLVDAKVHTELSRNEKLSFVYDFCGPTRTFDSLNFTRNAAKPPLRDRISDEEFLRVYGLPKSLAFVPASERVASEHDYWAPLYGP